jgi:hypothetical protein
MNIWEVVCVKDLSKILKESPNKFVIVGLVLESTEKKLQSYIKKFLKEKSQVYPNMIFIFYKVTNKDFNKISLINSNSEEYPIIYSIFDCDNIFVKVNMAEPSTIMEAFNAVKSYYDDDLLKFLEAKSSKTESKSESKSELELTSIQPSMSQAELMESQQKLMEKILCLETKTKEYNLELLEDIKKRKQCEYLLKNKKKS